jgi:hypothetical protein
MSLVRAGVCSTALLVGAWLSTPAAAVPIKVLHSQGSAHGFVEVVTLAGKRIAVGDMLQDLRGTVVSTRLVLRFFDGSLDDETTIYSESGTFRFISDHHVQHGPSFPTPIDETVDARHGLVSVRDPNGKTTRVQQRMPADVYNGLAATLLMNRRSPATETTIAVVVAEPEPRIIHLSMRSVGEPPFTMGSDPAFIREEGPLYVGGPVWRIQQISADFPDEAARGAAPR